MSVFVKLKARHLTIVMITYNLIHVWTSILSHIILFVCQVEEFIIYLTFIYSGSAGRCTAMDVQ